MLRCIFFEMSVSVAGPAGAASFGVQAGHLLPQSLPSPAESWFVGVTDGVPALACMHLAKGFLFEACR